jgi:hypothetical protein
LTHVAYTTPTHAAQPEGPPERIAHEGRHGRIGSSPRMH